MGKSEQQQLPLQQQQAHRGTRSGGAAASTFFRERCLLGFSRIGREFNFKCMVILILGFAVLLSAIFWVIPLRSKHYGFDAKDEIKLGATVQAYFELEKPVSMLIPHIGGLEYDIFGEIGVPYTKVAILSMHEGVASNRTNVVFGFLSDLLGVSINAVSLSVLRSSLIELFLQQTNLTLTTTFGQPTFFEILKFPWGITVIPEQHASFWQIPQILFNFTLNNSINDITENLDELKEQLKLGLRLRPYENVYVQVTNINGSTRDPPVTVQASVTSELGSLSPQRLKQLAQIITGSPPAKNLGLNNTVFGKVKEISLSSYLNHSIHATPPSPSPAPSPDQKDYGEDPAAPNQPFAPSHSPAPSPHFYHRLPPCFNCDASSPSSDGYLHAPSPGYNPHPSISPIASSSSPSPIHVHPPHHPHSHCSSTSSPSPSQVFHVDPPSPASQPLAYAPSPSPLGPSPHSSSNLSPLPVVSYSSSPRQDEYPKGSVSSPVFSPSVLPLPSSFALGPYCREIWSLSFCGLLMFHLLCWSHR